MKRYFAPFLIVAFLLICLVKINAVVGQDLGKVKSKAEHKKVYAQADKYSDELGGESIKYTSGPSAGSSATLAPGNITITDNSGYVDNIVRASTLGNEIGRERLTLSTSQKRFSATTSLYFTLRHEGNYKLEILNLNGTIVTVLAEGNGKAGESLEHQFKKGNSPAGNYIGRLITEHEVTSTRFELE